jgi:hypothetical protein
MAVPAGLRVELPHEMVFPHGFLASSVEADIDFNAPREGDRQARDKVTGKRVWVVAGMDMDPDASRFGRSASVKVKVLADHQPVLPSSPLPGYPPLVEFVELQITPYMDERKCQPPRDGKPHRCRAQMVYSFRATGVREPSTMPVPAPGPASEVA